MLPSVCVSIAATGRHGTVLTQCSGISNCQFAVYCMSILYSPTWSLPARVGLGACIGIVYGYFSLLVLALFLRVEACPFIPKLTMALQRTWMATWSNCWPPIGLIIAIHVRAHPPGVGVSGWPPSSILFAPDVVCSAGHVPSQPMVCAPLCQDSAGLRRRKLVGICCSFPPEVLDYIPVHCLTAFLDFCKNLTRPLLEHCWVSPICVTYETATLVKDCTTILTIAFSTHCCQCWLLFISRGNSTGGDLIVFGCSQIWTQDLKESCSYHHDSAFVMFWTNHMLVNILGCWLCAEAL